MKKLLVLIVAVLLIISTGIPLALHIKLDYINDKTLRFLGHSYTKYYYQYDVKNQIWPYGDETILSFLDRPKEKHLFGLMFYKGDKEHNFIYYKSLLGTTIYKRDDCVLSELSNDLPIDYICIYNRKTKDCRIIYDESSIKKVVQYYLEMDNEYTPYEGDINAFAYCNSLGGFYQLRFEATESSGNVYNDSLSGRHELPKELCKILIE